MRWIKSIIIINVYILLCGGLACKEDYYYPASECLSLLTWLYRGINLEMWKFFYFFGVYCPPGCFGTVHKGIYHSESEEMVIAIKTMKSKLLATATAIMSIVGILCMVIIQLATMFKISLASASS